MFAHEGALIIRYMVEISQTDTCARLWSDPISHLSCSCFLKLTTRHDHLGSSNPFPDHHFTGPLRPAYPLSPKRLVPDGIPLPDYTKDGELTDQPCHSRAAY